MLHETSSAVPRPYHGRMLVIDRTNSKESTGHGSPLPVLVHGGPGKSRRRRGNGRHPGREALHATDRIQSSPTMIAAITASTFQAAPKHFVGVAPVQAEDVRAQPSATRGRHPAGRSRSRTSSISPSSPATNFTPTWTKKQRRLHRSSKAGLPHGYLILSFAAGLFVWPDPGPVLANTGLENLRFLTPAVSWRCCAWSSPSEPSRSSRKKRVRFAGRSKSFNQKDELVATYPNCSRPKNVPERPRAMVAAQPRSRADSLTICCRPPAPGGRSCSRPSSRSISRPKRNRPAGRGTSTSSSRAAAKPSAPSVSHQISSPAR